jgi:hypothetical protein
VENMEYIQPNFKMLPVRFHVPYWHWCSFIADIFFVPCDWAMLISYFVFLNPRFTAAWFQQLRNYAQLAQDIKKNY